MGFRVYELKEIFFITKTCLYNFDPLKPHFYIVKLEFTGVYIIFLISVQNIDCGYIRGKNRRYFLKSVCTVFTASWNRNKFLYKRNISYHIFAFSLLANRECKVINVPSTCPNIIIFNYFEKTKKKNKKKKKKKKRICILFRTYWQFAQTWYY